MRVVGYVWPLIKAVVNGLETWERTEDEEEFRIM